MTQMQVKWLALGLALAIGWACAGVTQANEIAISDDGREIRLNGDGSWVQLDRDRFATTASGERVRLKPDGSWVRVGASQAAGESSPAVSDAGPASTTSSQDASLYLAKVEILKKQIKRAKSVHAETRTIYHLQVHNDSDKAIQLGGDLAASLTAGSSSGAQYPITSVAFDGAIVAPGQRSTLRITAAGSPQWFGIKSMNLEVAALALGNTYPRVLMKSMDDVERRLVDNFD